MMQYKVIKQRAKHLKYKECDLLKELTKASKNLYNKALYIKRKNFFEIKAIRKSINRSKLTDDRKKALLKRDDLKILTYNELYHIIKHEPEYKVLNANMSQQILKEVEGSFASFFELLKLKGSGSYKKKVKLPNYLKDDAYFSLVIAEFSLKNNVFTLPMNRTYKKSEKLSFIVPEILEDKRVKEIRVVPKQNASFFELHYIYEEEASIGIYDTNNGLAIDLGIDNLMTCTTNTGKAFIIDGRKIKSINQFANKENARLKSILNKQKRKGSKRINKLWYNRGNKIQDYILKSCSYVVEYCKKNDIGNIVLGWNEDFTRNSNMGKVNNQNFVNIPYGKIKKSLEYMCLRAGIKLHLQEESYTSKASFFDKDDIPIYSKEDKTEYIFSGTRVGRGRYRTANGTLINADINGSLNILKKCNVVSLNALYARGAVDTPQRIRLT